MTSDAVAFSAQIEAYAALFIAGLIAAIAVYVLLHPTARRLPVIAAGRQFERRHAFGGLAIAFAIFVQSLPAAVHPTAADRFVALYGPLGRPVQAATMVVAVALVIVALGRGAWTRALRTKGRV